MKESLKESVDRSQKHVPDDAPPVSNIGSKIAFVFFIIGSILAVFINHLYFPLVLLLSLTVMMIDSARQLNVGLKREGRIRAEYVFGLAAGGFIVSFSSFILLVFGPIQPSIVIAGMISTLSFFIYEYILIIVIRRNIDTDEVYVRKLPRKPTEGYYIFTEEEYISLVEDAALDGEFKPIN